MGSFIFEMLCEIANLKNLNQASNRYLQIQLLIYVVQVLALQLPNDGWNLWKYEEDPILHYFQKVINCFLVLPIQQNQEWLQQIITYSCFAIQGFVFFIFILLIIQKQLLRSNINEKLSLFFMNFTYFYLLNINFSISIPLELFYLKAIFCTKFDSNQCYTQPIFVISLIGISLTVISQLASIYFLRSYTFRPFSILQRKYSLNQILIALIQPILITFYLFEVTQFNSYIRLIAQNCLLITLLFEYNDSNPFFPPNNEFNFKIIFLTFSISILITFNVLSENTVIPEHTLLMTILLVGSAGYYFSKVYIHRKSFWKSHSKLLDQSKSIDIVQKLHMLSQILKQQSRQEIFFIYYFLLLNYSEEQCNCRISSLSSRQFIVQFLQNQLALAKAMIRISFEQVELIYIDFLSLYCKKPLLGLVEFRRYDIFHQQQQSLYFKQMKKYINEDLEKLVQKSQLSNDMQLHAREQEKQSLEIVHISKSIMFEDQFLPQIIRLIDSKIQFWEQLIKGYNTIYEFQDEAISLSKKVQILSKLLLPNLSFDVDNIDHLGSNCNVLELKVASIYYSSVMNDYYNSAQCEFQIQEIFNIEHTLSSNIITNFTLVDDKVALIMVSLVKSLGEIINQDKRALGQYFGYDEKEFQSIQFINQLMPPYMSAIHNNLLQEYLQKAKSKLFSSYNLVFSISKQGFLIPQQLKIDNNFLISDDYVIMGCLSQIKKEADFILFGEDGKIWGCTENFYLNYIQNDKIILQRFINQCYIYLLIPQIIKIIESYKIQLSEILNESFFIEETASLIISQNLFDVINQCQRQSFTIQTKTSLNQRSLMRQHNTVTEGSLSKQIDLIFQKEKQSKNNNHQEEEFPHEEDIVDDQVHQFNIPLLDKQYQQEIQQMMSLNDEKLSEKYFIKFGLSFKSIGKDAFQRSYFILEIQDLRKRDFIGKSISTNQQLNSHYQSMQNNQNLTDICESNQNISGFTQTEKPYSEIVPLTKDMGYSVSNILQRLTKPEIKQGQEQPGQYNQDSARDSLSYGPLSQRAHFINPNQKHENLEEIGRMDQEFNELGLNFNSASAVLQNQQFDVEFEIDDSVNKQQQQQQGKSSSNQEKEKEILNIIQLNQLKGKNHEEEEIEVLKSKSSFTSGTSGNSAIQLIKNFQNLTHLTQSLKSITFIFILLFIILIVLIAIHLVIITQGNEETKLAINDINGPFVLNRSYLEVISFAWTLIMGSMNIVGFSDFIYSQTMSDLTNTTETLYDEINMSYNGFIQVEEKGLLSEQEYTFLNGVKEKMKFPYFIRIIEESLNGVVYITKLKTLNPDVLITQDYLNNLLLLRYNLNQVYQMSSELIDSLNSIFLSSTQEKVTAMQTQVIVEIICIALILVIELYFWRQIQSYCQQLMLLTGRLQESDANELIARATLVKETLAQKSGKLSWKKQNYWIMNYQNLNQVNLDLFNSSSRQVKDLIQKNNLDYNKMKLNKKTGKQEQNSIKRNLNVVLSSRIYNTQINIMEYLFMLIIVFVILGLLLFGGFILFSQQSSDLSPSQTLAANYIKFTSKLDTLMACAQIINTQKVFYKTLVNMDIYDQKIIDQFPETNDILVLFSTLSQIYAENLTLIYQDIISSNKIKQADKQALLTLYEEDFCLELSDEIPMCNLDEFGYEKFTQVFGKPDLQFDDNSEYVNKGIVGIVSRLDSFFKYEFDYEIEYQQFNPDLELMIQQINSKQFRNAVFSHFLDTNDGTNTFLEIIQKSTYGILGDNIYYIYLYYGILGFGLVFFYSVYYIILIINTNNRLIRIRLALITLPVSILTDQHTISMLKRLN